MWFVLNAPDRDAVERHHAKLGIECEWIHQAESARERVRRFSIEQCVNRGHMPAKARMTDGTLSRTTVAL